MSTSRFFDAEAILVDRSIRYTESLSQGAYAVDRQRILEVIRACWDANDSDTLNQVVKEIFWVCNQGRRPWSLDAERTFLELASMGVDLLGQMRARRWIAPATYAFIDPLAMILNLTRVSGHLEHCEGERWRATEPVLDSLVTIYGTIWDWWASDHPEAVKLPSHEDIAYLLETDDDDDFRGLLTTMAKTRSPLARQLLVEFCDDDEPSVAALAEGLLATWFDGRRIGPHGE